MPDHPFGALSLLPPVAAIALAILTRRIILSLLFGVFVGALVTTHGQPLSAAADTLELHVWKTLVDESKLRVFSFTLLMGALVGVINRSGGMRGLVDALVPFARTRRSGQLLTWFLGLLIFFDDYANTMLLGNTLRPLCDRLKISREKLAYLVDSTAAPVAGLALVSTWVAVEIAYVQDGLDNLPIQADLSAFDLFVASIPYRFYMLFALVIVPLVAILGRDFGPMLAAERDAIAGKMRFDLRSAPMSHYATEPDPQTPARWFNAVIPISIALVVIVWLMYSTGEAKALARHGDVELNLRQIFGEADSGFALQYGAIAGLVAAAALALGQKLLSAEQLVTAAGAGSRVVLPAIAILVLASAMSRMTGGDAIAGYEPAKSAGPGYPNRAYRLYTGEYLTGLLGAAPIDRQADDAAGDAVQAGASGLRTDILWLLPTIVFVLSSIVAFSTGTSWGTMGILLPMTVPLVYQMLAATGGRFDGQDPILLSSVGGVLAGAVFGDHCSPISDTTVLSSQSSGCDHAAHVWTQMPYAIAVGGTSILLGTLPVGLGAPLWLLLPAQGIAVLAIVRFVGRKVETSPEANSTQAG